MSDYASEDVDSLRVIAEYVGGTEHEVFLAGLADRMEQVIVEAQPVFTREDVDDIRTAAKRYHSTVANVYWGDDAMRLIGLADRIERTLPAAVLESA